MESHDLRFVTFDGLNAWFVTEAEWPQLSPSIARPPSPVLDWYHPAYYVTAMSDRDAEIARLRAELANDDIVHRARRGATRVARRAVHAARRIVRRRPVSEPAREAS